jgi:hypothetical protein
MSLNLDLHQLKQAVAILGGDYETQLTIKQFADGSVHAWVAEYPDEGSVLLVPAPEAIKQIEQETPFTVMINTLADPLALVGTFAKAEPGAERQVYSLDVGLTQGEVDAIWAAAIKRLV